MKIYDKIRQVREIHQWTQEEMAEKMNMSTSGYAKIERGDTKLKFDKLEQIAQIFNMDVSELMSIGDKGMIFLINESGDYVNANYYASNENLAVEIETLKSKIQHNLETIKLKNELLEQKDREIEGLKEITKYSTKL